VEAGPGPVDQLDIHLRGNLQGGEEHRQGSLLPRPFPLRRHDQPAGQGGDAGRCNRRHRVPLQAYLAEDPRTIGVVRRHHSILLLSGGVLRRGDHVLVVQ